jgi:hypothetical protein
LHIKKRHFLITQDMADKEQTTETAAVTDVNAYLAENYPDENLASDADKLLFLANRDQQYQQGMLALKDFIDANPEVGALIAQVMAGEKFPQEVLTRFFADGAEFDEHLAQMESGNPKAYAKTRKVQAAQQQREAQELMAAEQQFVQDFEAWKQSRKIGEEEAARFAALLEKYLRAIADKKITAEEYDDLFGAFIGIDQKVEAARREGQQQRAAAQEQARTLAQKQGKAAMPPSAPSSKGANGADNGNADEKYRIPNYF